MAKIRFKSIFDRMLFLQCVTVLSLLLILGLGIGFVSRMQSLSMEKSILAEKGQQAARVLEAGGDQEDLRSLTEERKLLIQVLYPEETISAYSDEKWTPLAELPREKTRAADALRRSGTVPEAMERYFAGAKLPTYTVFVRLGEGDKTSVLLIHSDISPWNESFRQLALWTLAICVVAAFVILFSSYYTELQRDGRPAEEPGGHPPKLRGQRVPRASLPPDQHEGLSGSHDGRDHTAGGA